MPENRLNSKSAPRIERSLSRQSGQVSSFIQIARLPRLFINPTVTQLPNINLPAWDGNLDGILQAVWHWNPKFWRNINFWYVPLDCSKVENVVDILFKIVTALQSTWHCIHISHQFSRGTFSREACRRPDLTVEVPRTKLSPGYYSPVSGIPPLTPFFLADWVKLE